MRILRWSLRRRTETLTSVVVALTVVIITAANGANAQTQQISTARAVDTAIEVFSQAGNMPGLPINIYDPAVRPVVEGLVSCAMSGASGGDCAKNILVSVLLGGSGAVDPPVGSIGSAAGPCLTSGRAPGSCVSTTDINRLPPEAQPLANCVLGGGNLGDCVIKSTEGLIVQQLSQAAGPDASNAVGAIMNCVASQTAVAQCAAQQLTNNLPDSVKPFATCLSQGGTMQSCAAYLAAAAVVQNSPQAAALVACLRDSDGNAMQQCAVKAGLSAASAAGQAVQQAVSVISNLKVDASAADATEFPQEPAVLQNIVLLAQGIQTGDWVKMGVAAGPEILETDGKIILSVFVTPPLAGLLAPVVGLMI